MRFRNSVRSRFLAIILATLWLGACSSQDSGSGLIAPEEPEMLDVNMYSLNKLVCDPFNDENNNTRMNRGLKAELFYLKDGQEEFNDVTSYIDKGTSSDQFLFFSQVNVPTRLFDLGFPKETGGVVQTDSGEDLVEYFALRFSSVLTLGPDDEAGTYQLALLSDDGSILRVRNESGEYETVVENDGEHPTRFGCGETIEMGRDSQKLIKMDYYQGPRRHISLIPMWRKVSESTKAEPLCGQKGNSKYFDYRNNSKPQRAYKDLLARGWKALDADNYSLPATALFNPCAQGEAPLISNFDVEDILDGSLRVTWTTDIPATAQVRVVNMETGAEILTESDNVLRTEHSEVISQLQPGTNYLIQGVSISKSYGKSISAPATIQLD